MFYDETFHTRHATFPGSSTPALRDYTNTRNPVAAIRYKIISGGRYIRPTNISPCNSISAAEIESTVVSARRTTANVPTRKTGPRTISRRPFFTVLLFVCLFITSLNEKRVGTTTTTTIKSCCIRPCSWATAVLCSAAPERLRPVSCRLPSTRL